MQYEGNESSKYVVYGGSVPNQQILPAIDWLMSPDGGAKKKIFLLGSDYVFPRTANFVAKKYLESKGLRPVGEVYLPLGHRDFEPAVQQLQFSAADCVLSTVNGDSNLGLFAALANVDTAANRQWVDGFRQEFGNDRVTGDPMEPDWCLVHLWKMAVEKAGSFETEAVRQAFAEGLEFAGPGGTVRLDPKTQHCTKYFRVGRIRSDRQFDIVHSSEAPLEPEPYPQIAFPGWKCDWTAEGITRGAEVSIDGDV